MKTTNIAVLSAWHVHAEEYARAFAQVPGIKVCCLWDDDQERGQEMAHKLDIPFVKDVDLIFADPDIRAVQVTSATDQHEDLMIAAARSGKHIFTEKVLTIGVEAGERVRAAIEDSSIQFAISFPHLCRPALLKAKAIADSGELGQIGYARVRNAHNGAVAGWLPERFFDPAACGGGAMMDLGAHPMYTLAWLLGEPQKVQSTFTHMTGKQVEDNAVSVLQFPGGAIGVSETSFVASHNPYTLELSGTKGSLLVRDQKVYVTSESTQGKPQEVTGLPNAPASPLHQFAEALLSAKHVISDEFGIDKALRLTRIMSMAYAT